MSPRYDLERHARKQARADEGKDVLVGLFFGFVLWLIVLFVGTIIVSAVHANHGRFHGALFFGLLSLIICLILMQLAVRAFRRRYPRV